MSGVIEGIAVGNMFADRNALYEAHKNAGEWEKVWKETKSSLDLANEYVVEFLKALAGNRTLIRELLEELKKADPSNPFLAKSLRDMAFKYGYDRQEKLLPGMTYTKLSDEIPKFRDLAFGATDAKKGGPESHQISPCLELRTELEVPAHIVERERMIEVIKKLADEIKKTNPTSDVLKDVGL